MASSFQWNCPFCDRAQVVTTDNYRTITENILTGDSKFGPARIRITAIRCLNADCNDLTLSAQLVARIKNMHGVDASGSVLEGWALRPQSSARPQPDYIPEAIREDYKEACLIRDLSPKASATLARRCLQGMIRDFCKISKGRLIDEINELQNRVAANSAPSGVTEESVEAIDHVRKIGNIGAHMEADVNAIIEIDPNEAQALIDLIEMLFKEWYVARRTRQERLARIAAIGQEKADAKTKSKKSEGAAK